MRQRISKKILLCFSLLAILGTFNNQYLYDFAFPKIKSIEILGFEKEKNNLLNQINDLNLKSLFFLDQKEIMNILDSNHLIENYFIFKKYPYSLQIKIIKTKFLANVNNGTKKFYLGSNGKLIISQNEVEEIPFIFGKFENKNFFSLKKIIDNSSLDYGDIKNLYAYPSGRWDIETKSGILIKLSKDNIQDALNLSLNLLNDEKFRNVNLIDVRQLNQVVTDGK